MAGMAPVPHTIFYARTRALTASQVCPPLWLLLSPLASDLCTSCALCLGRSTGCSPINSCMPFKSVWLLSPSRALPCPLPHPLSPSPLTFPVTILFYLLAVTVFICLSSPWTASLGAWDYVCPTRRTILSPRMAHPRCSNTQRMNQWTLITANV